MADGNGGVKGVLRAMPQDVRAQCAMSAGDVGRVAVVRVRRAHLDTCTPATAALRPVEVVLKGDTQSAAPTPVKVWSASYLIGACAGFAAE